MNFSEKLNQLMDLFSISNSQMAKQLCIDPSLVSKWRHGNRLPARNASYIRELVFYFHDMYRAADAIIQHRLRRMLGESAELHLDDSEMMLKQLFLEWLNPMENDSQQANEILSGPQSRRVIAMMQQLLSKDSHSLPEETTRPTNPVVPGGTLHQFHLYAGRSGSRQAVLEFLDMALQMAPPQELLLHSQEDMTWMSENPDFLQEWNRKLMAVLTRGHRISIIHHMDRGEKDLLSMMQYWIPMHLTGNVRSWYYPVYKEMPLQHTHFILRNVAAIYASVNRHTEDQNTHTFFFRDPLAARIMEDSYRVYLSQCVPLVKTYLADRMDAYQNELAELEEEPGTWIGWKNGLSSAALSVSLYEQLLTRADIGGAERWKRLQLQQRRLEAFRRNIDHFSYIEVLPLSLVNQLRRQNETFLSPLEAFTPESLPLPREALLALLEAMVERLQKYPNYEIYLANANPLWKEIDMSLGYKENRAALAGSLGPAQQRPAVLVANEGNIVLTFESFLESALDRIPGNYKNRQRVIDKLQKVIAQYRREHLSSRLQS